MQSEFVLGLRQIPVLLRGELEPVRQWTRTWDGARARLYVGVILMGAGIYGFGMGCWRSPLQGLYTAIKLPLVILLTTAGNAMLNGMLAPLLGLNITFRQSLSVVLISFTIAAAIMGAFSPQVLFIVWNTPPVTASSNLSALAYSCMQLSHFALIAFAGVAANVRLFPLLQSLGQSTAVAYKVLFAWLTGNLFLGSQICWVLRPFIGPPGMKVEFLGSHPFQGSLYETVFEAVRQLMGH